MLPPPLPLSSPLLHAARNAKIGDKPLVTCSSTDDVELHVQGREERPEGGPKFRPEFQQLAHRLEEAGQSTAT